MKDGQHESKADTQLFNFEASVPPYNVGGCLKRAIILFYVFMVYPHNQVNKDLGGVLSHPPAAARLTVSWKCPLVQLKKKVHLDHTYLLPISDHACCMKMNFKKVFLHLLFWNHSGPGRQWNELSVLKLCGLLDPMALKSE